MATSAVAFVLGLVFLAAGGELLVRSASRLASALGVSRLVIGLTVVAFGTSAPEAVVSIMAAWQGSDELAIGNVVGSNIFNVLFILGVSALIVPLAVTSGLVRFDVPLLFGISVALLVLVLDGRVDRVDGIVLWAALAAYLWFSYRRARDGPDVLPSDGRPRPGGAPRPVVDGLLVLASLGLLVLGSRWLVDAASTFARWLGLSPLVIGLTIVAAGTSLPEVATSIMAAIRGERDIAVGNVVGSNIFNILGVLGIAAVLSPRGLRVPDAVVSFDLPVMLAATAACLPVFFTGLRISRWEGGLLLGYYAIYAAYLVLRATEHDALHALTWTVGWFVLPLTVLTLVIVTAGSRGRPVGSPRGRGSRK